MKTTPQRLCASARETLESESAKPSWLAPSLIVAIAAQALFLDAATSRTSQAVILIEFGLLLLACPPRRALGPLLNGLLALVVVGGCVCFLPQRWFPVPEWRERLAPYFETVLPATVSPQPWQSLEGQILLVLGLAWFYWAATAPLSTRTRHLTVRLYAATTILFAGACLWFYARHHLPPLWYSQRGFGPFPNRNDNANVLGIGALLAVVCAIDGIRKGRKRGYFFAAGSIILLVALVLNLSRAGLLIPFFGLAFWAALTFAKERSWKVMSVAVACLVFSWLGVIIFGGDIAGRFSAGGVSPVKGLLGLRAEIQSDAVHFGLKSALTGVGSRNFEPLFVLYRDATRTSPGRISHPESDWLWFWIEAGWLGALGVVGASAGFLAAAWTRIRQQPSPIENAIFAALVVFLAHSTINPSTHALSAALPVLLLGGLLINPTARPCSWAPTLIFRMTGAALAGVGAVWIASAFGAVQFSGSQTVSDAVKLTRKFLAKDDYSRAVEASTTGLAASPLEWELYFDRAIARAGAHEDFAALTDFKRAEILQPNRSEVLVHEGNVWAARIPAFALRAWGEALAEFPAEAPQIFRQILPEANSPQLSAGLHTLARTDFRLLLIWLQQSTPEEFSREAKAVFQRDPELAGSTPDQVREFLEIWSRKAPLREAAAAVKAHPAWEKAGWSIVARNAAATGDFEAAYRSARQNLPEPVLPPATSGSIEELSRDLLVEPTNSAVAYALIVSAEKAGDLDRALRAAKQRTEHGDAPSYFYALEAELAAKRDNWPLAWAAIAKYGGLSP